MSERCEVSEGLFLESRPVLTSSIKCSGVLARVLHAPRTCMTVPMLTQAALVRVTPRSHPSGHANPPNLRDDRDRR